MSNTLSNNHILNCLLLKGTLKRLQKCIVYSRFLDLTCITKIRNIPGGAQTWHILCLWVFVNFSAWFLKPSTALGSYWVTELKTVSLEIKSVDICKYALYIITVCFMADICSSGIFWNLVGERNKTLIYLQYCLYSLSILFYYQQC